MQKFKSRIEYTMAPETSEMEGIVHIRGRGRNVVDYYGRREVCDFTGMESDETLKFEYEHYDIIGKLDGITVSDEYGLEATGHIYRDIEAGQYVYPLVKHGIPMEASITFEGLFAEDLNAGQETEVNGVPVVGPLRIYRKWKLCSISLCSYGVDGTTQVTPVKMTKGGSRMAQKKYSDAETVQEEKKPCFDDVAQTTQQTDPGKPETEENADEDKDTRIAELEAIVAELQAKLQDAGLLSEAGIEAVETEDVIEDSDETKIDEKTEDEEKTEKEMSRLRKEVRSLKREVEKLVTQTRMGYTPKKVDPKQYRNTHEYLSALETQRLQNYRTKIN